AATEALFGRSAMNLLGHEFGFPLAHAEIGDLTIVRPDQSVAIITLDLTDIAWYGASAYLVRMSDVTFERRSEQLLVEAQQLFHQALDSMTSGVVMIDTEGVIIAANQAWQSFLATQNFPPEYGKIGSSYLRLAKRLIAASEPPSPTMIEGLYAVLTGQRSHYQSEYALVMDQGTRWFAMNVLACREGHKICAIVTHEETTRQHQRDDLEIDSRQTLELIARQRSLEAVVARILLMTQNRHPDSIYIALLVPDAEVFRSLPSEMLLPDERALLDHWAKDYALSANDEEGDTLAIQAIDMAKAEARWPALCPLLSTRHIVMVWRAPVRAGTLGVVAQLICCRRVSLVPNADDLVFMELVGQLLAIAIEQHEHTRQLAYQSYHDPLTGLPNRLLFEDRLHQALEIARRSGNLMAVMMLDLDRFKQINDTLGHTVGDTLLIQLARRFEGCVRTTDTLARRGGDEFMLVLPDVSGAQQVTRVARRLHDALRTPFV
ncbi:MAG: diguanylate cyclase, partial [Chloroflexia bacterium]|nr:diguanylate cyclase [Chloroflexia bacterium]